MKYRYLLMTGILVLLCSAPRSLWAMTEGEKASIAVTPFKGIDVSPEHLYLSHALPEIISAQLQKVPQIQIVNRDRVADLLKEQSFADAGYTTQSASRMGKLIAAEYVLSGSFQIESGQLVVTTQLIDVESGELKYNEQKTYPLKNTLIAQQEIATGIAQSLSLKLDEDVQQSLKKLSVNNEQAVKHYLKAQEALKTKKYAEAQRSFLAAIEEEIGFIQAHQGFQQASEALGNYTQQVECYRQWIKDNPEQYFLSNYLGNIYQAREEWSNAENAYMQVIIKDRSFALAYNNLGVLLMRTRKNPQEAKSWLEKALHINDLEPLTWYNLGRWHYEQKEHVQGQHAFRKALELSHGEYLTEIQDALFGGSLAIKSRAITLPGGEVIGEVLFSRKAQETVTLFRIYDTLGGFTPQERAQIVAQRIKADLFKLTPDNITAGTLNREQVVKTQSNSLIITVGQKAAERIQLNRQELAKEWSKKLSYMLAYEGMPYRTRGNADDPEYIQRLQKGDVYYSEGNLEAAILAYTEAASIKRDLYAAHYSLGKIYQEQGRYPEAEAAFETIIKMQPDYTQAHLALGELYIKTAHYDWAKRFLSRVLSLDPQNAHAQQLLQEL